MAKKSKVIWAGPFILDLSGLGINCNKKYGLPNWSLQEGKKPFKNSDESWNEKYSREIVDASFQNHKNLNKNFGIGGFDSKKSMSNKQNFAWEKPKLKNSWKWLSVLLKVIVYKSCGK